MDNKQYIKIPIRDLPLGKSSFDFDLGDEFFKSMDSDIFGGDVFYDIDIERLSSYIHVKWYLEGSVKVECDRCLDVAELNGIISEGEFIIKLEGRPEEDSDNEDTLYAYHSDEFIGLDKYCFDSLYLALPIQRTHSAEVGCNPEMLKFIQKAD